MSAALEATSIGPVDVAVILFEGSTLSGEVAPALADLHDSGTVRVIDVAFVRKEADGATSIVEVGDAEVAEWFDIAEWFDKVDDAQFDLLSDEDLAEIAGGLEAGASAMVIVWENSWASRFAAAVRASHGRLIVQERIPRETVLRAIAALDEE